MRNAYIYIYIYINAHVIYTCTIIITIVFIIHILPALNYKSLNHYVYILNRIYNIHNTFIFMFYNFNITGLKKF